MSVTPDRWQDDPGRAEQIRAWLGDVERARLAREDADARLPTADRVDLPRLQARADGARKGVDAAIMMALAAKVGVPSDEIARRAGVESAHVEALRARLRRP